MRRVCCYERPRAPSVKIERESGKETGELLRSRLLLQVSDGRLDEKRKLGVATSGLLLSMVRAVFYKFMAASGG